jgi:5'-methylthioadenosine phosphorylase
MKLGVIGGTGLYDLPGLEISDRFAVDTPFGKPSARITTGKLGQTELVFLPRHGAAHDHTPSELPYRANIYALKSLGVTHLLTISAVGSLKEELPPLTVVFPDQIIDRTLRGQRTFFDRGVVAHVGIADPYCGEFTSAIVTAARGAGLNPVSGGTYVCIEGPQFSTKAESKLYRSWNADIIGMTAMPEARLAREAELCYATAAMVTDYDVWHESEEAVSVKLVRETLARNVEAGRAIIEAIARTGLPPRECACKSALDYAVVTQQDAITSDIHDRLGVITERLPIYPTR